MKLKELLGGLSSLVLSEAEVVSVMALLRDKSPHTLDTWHKVSGRRSKKKMMMMTNTFVSYALVLDSVPGRTWQ